MLCAVCRARALVTVHEPGGGSVSYCTAHAPVAVFFEDDAQRLEAAVSAGADDAGTLYDLAVLRLRAERPAEAAKLLERVVAREPSRTAVLELLSTAKERVGDLEAAERYSRMAIEAAPQEGMRHAGLARILALRDRVEEALEVLEAGFAADPFCFECCRRASILRIAMRRAERAVELCRRYLETTEARGDEVIPVDAGDRPATAADFPSGLALEEARRPVEERRRHVVAVNRYQARVLLGDALRSLGREAEAQREYERAGAELSGVPDLLVGDLEDSLGREAASVRALAAFRNRSGGPPPP